MTIPRPPPGRRGRPPATIDGVPSPSDHDRWTAVDGYLADLLLAPDAALDATLAASDAAGLPSHGVSALQGRLLELLARVQGARTILELGTLGGYSTIWLAPALPPAAGW
jgi:predicted O-methyltransferase YrrM